MSELETHPSMIEQYAQVLRLTEQMLDAAQKADWDRLVKTEIERGRLIDAVRERDAGAAPTSEMVDHQRRAIEAILELDHQIKLLTQDWMHELRDILGSATAQRLLQRTYSE